MKKNKSNTNEGLLFQIGLVVAVFLVMIFVCSAYSPSNEELPRSKRTQEMIDEEQIQEMYDYHTSQGRNVFYDGTEFKVIE